MNSIFALGIYTLLLIGNAVYGQNTGKVANLYRLALTPPPQTFIIWGVIYTGLFLVVIRSFFTNSFRNGRLYLFAISSILNVCWLIVFGNTNINLFFQYAILLLLYISLLLLYVSYVSEKYSFEKKVFGLYFGWVSIAVVLSGGIFFVKQLGIPEFIFTFFARFYLFITPIGFYTIFGIYPVLPYIWLLISSNF